MKKDGFIFIETITVLVVVALSLSMLLASYSLIVKRNNIKKYYNRPSETYLLYAVTKLGTSVTENYTTKLSDDFANNEFFTDKNSCGSSLMKYFLTNCKQVFNDTNMINFGIITDVNKAVKEQYANYDAGMLKFLEQLKRKNDDNSKNLVYFVGRFYINKEYYYASIQIEEK